MKFILIMTFAAANYTDSAVSVSSVEFANKQACLNAGAAWAKSLNQKYNYGRDVATFICAEKGKE